MRRAILKHRRDFVAIVVMIVLAVIPGVYILSHQRFYLPAWVPIAGTDFFEVKAEFQTAQAIAPGQGQTVNVAGVTIGEIKSVELSEGKALVTMVIRRKYSELIRKDATMLLRPKTGLKDMIVEITPGEKTSPAVPEGYTFPVAQTAPDINLDEFLAGLDRDTRDYLRMLLNGGAEGLRDNGAQTAATLKRFEPLNRDIAKASKLVAQRRRNVKSAIHNLQLLLTELGTKDEQLTELIDSSNAVFADFAAQDANLQKTLELLPGALGETNTALAKSDKLNSALEPTLRELNPGIKGFNKALPQIRRFSRISTPIIKNQIRPFTVEATPTIKDLKPAAKDFSVVTPRLETTFGIINNVLNAFAYDPEGDESSYLFWALWGSHIASSALGLQDAHGPLLRGVVITDCKSLQAANALGAANQWAATLVQLINLTPVSKCK